MVMSPTAVMAESAGSRLEMSGCHVVLAFELVQTMPPPVVPEVELESSLAVNVANWL